MASYVSSGNVEASLRCGFAIGATGQVQLFGSYLRQKNSFHQFGTFYIKPIIYKVKREDEQRYNVHGKLNTSDNCIRKWGRKVVLATVGNEHTIGDGSAHVELPLDILKVIEQYFVITMYDSLRMEFGSVLMDFSHYIPAPLVNLNRGIICPYPNTTFERILTKNKTKNLLKMPDWGTLPWFELSDWEYHYAMLTSYLWAMNEFKCPIPHTNAVYKTNQILKNLSLLSPRSHRKEVCNFENCAFCSMWVTGTKHLYELPDEEFYPLLHFMIRLNVQCEAIQEFCNKSLRNALVRMKIGYRLFFSESFEFVLNDTTTVFKRFPKTTKQRELARIYSEWFLNKDVRVDRGFVWINGEVNYSARRILNSVNCPLSPWLCERIRNAAATMSFDGSPITEPLVYGRTINHSESWDSGVLILY